MKIPFFDYAHGLSLNVMISEILLLIAALGVFGLCFMLYLIKKAVFPQAIRGALNISGAEELPPPYYEQNHDEIKYCKSSFAFEVS